MMKFGSDLVPQLLPNKNNREPILHAVRFDDRDLAVDACWGIAIGVIAETYACTRSVEAKTDAV